MCSRINAPYIHLLAAFPKAPSVMFNTERDKKTLLIICLAQFYVAKKGGQPLERIQKCHSLPETVELIPLRNTDVQSTTAHIL